MATIENSLDGDHQQPRASRIKCAAVSGMKLHFEQEDEETRIVLQGFAMEAQPIYRTLEKTWGQILDELIEKGCRDLMAQQEKTRDR